MSVRRLVCAAILIALPGCSPSSDGGGGSGGSNSPAPVIPGTLVIESTTPAPSQEDVYEGQIIEIRFSHSVAFSTITPATVSFATAAGPIPGSLGVMGNAVTFTPTADLPISLPVTGTVTTGVRGAGSESMTGAFSWTFRVRHAPQVAIDLPNLADPQVCAFPSGLILVAAVENLTRIVSRIHDPDTGWEAPIQEVVQENNSITHLRIFRLNGDEALAFWTAGAGTTRSIRCALFDSDRAWQGFLTLATDSWYSWGPPAIALHPEGWGGISYFAGNSVQFRYRSVNGLWSPAENPPPQVGYSVKLSPGADGALTGGCQSTPNPATGTTVTNGVRYEPGNGWTVTTLLNGGLSMIGAHSDAAGAAVLVGFSGGNVRSWRFENGTWTALSPVVPSAQPWGADYAMAPTGDGVVAWRETSGGVMSTVGAMLAAGGQWWGQLNFGSGNAFPDSPSVATGDDGKAWIAYSRPDTVRSIWLAQGVPAAGWMEPAIIDEDDFDSYAPDISIAGESGAVAWIRTNGGTELMVRLVD